MKRANKIFLQITFILVVSFFYGITAFPSLHNHQLFTELTASSNTLNPIECSESELFEDVQILKNMNVFKLLFTNNTKLLFKQNFFILIRPSFSIWQPPKLI